MERFVIVLVYSTFLIRELWTLPIFPECDPVTGEPKITPFPFREMAICFQTYVWMLSGYVVQFAVAIALYMLSKQGKFFFACLASLALLEIVEYLLTYNDYWLYVGKQGINITKLRYAILLFAMIVNFSSWTEKQ